MSGLLKVQIVGGKRQDKVVTGIIDLDNYEEEIKLHFCGDCDDKCTECVSESDECESVSDSFLEDLENELLYLPLRLENAGKKEAAEFCKKLYEAIKNGKVNSHEFFN